MDGLCVVRRVVRWSQLRVQTARTGSRQRAHNVVGCTASGIVWCMSGVRCVVVYGGGVRCVVFVAALCCNQVEPAHSIRIISFDNDVTPLLVEWLRAHSGFCLRVQSRTEAARPVATRAFRACAKCDHGWTAGGSGRGHSRERLAVSLTTEAFGKAP